jgi:bifunctional UDP-N-acetylglucosamine pyrophosphorylase/glucosamine-1-phosphate N-acetyltransferase
MTDASLAVVILAAGEGTRMKSATAKVLHPIAGVPMIGHVLSAVAALHPAHTVAVVRHERDAVAEAIAELSDGVVIVDQDDVPGTGRAVELAIAVLADFDGDVVVVSGDVPLLDAETLTDLIDEHRQRERGASVLSALVDDPSGYGRIVRDDSGEFLRIVEHKDAAEDELGISEINSGTYVFRASALKASLAKVGTANSQGEKYLTDVIELLVTDSLTVGANPVYESWVVAGVNDRAQLSDAQARLNAMIVRGHQLNGVSIDDPATTWIDRGVSIEPDAHILPGTFLKGATSIACCATVGPDTTLRDCEIGENANVTRTDATLAVIEANATVGPFSYLRPGTVLGEGGKIGAFVETKNAQIGRASKVPHLSYVGDAQIGEGSNIGASTVFVNYDGVEKHTTVIGDQVRVGSDTMLVAPVTIGDGAYTAAGSVITEDVPPGAMAVARAPQRNIEGWVERRRGGTKSAEAAARAKDNPKEDA